MLKVTQNARQIIKEILTSKSDDPELGVRLEVRPQDNHFVLFLAKEQAGDQLVEHEGIKLLMIAPDLAPIVNGMTLDVENTESGLTLVINK